MSKNLWYKNAIYSPRDFFQELQRVSVRKNNIEFTGFNQNDSQEFLQFILESFHNVLSQEVVIKIEGDPDNEYEELSKKAYESYRTFFEKDYSEIIEIFYGQYFTQVETITEDKVEKNSSFEPFNMLSLPIMEDRDSSINECLDLFVKEEELYSSDEKRIKKKVMFWSLPEILIISLKRYTNDLTKITANVSFPLDNLNLSKYVKGCEQDSFVYSLYGVSNHTGGMGGGHYWSYIKNEDDQWYKFDDNVVSTLSPDKVASEKAYCLFYKKNS